MSEAELDGLCTVRAYWRLSITERAFRSFKTVDLKVRPRLPRSFATSHEWPASLREG